MNMTVVISSSQIFRSENSQNGSHVKFYFVILVAVMAFSIVLSSKIGKMRRIARIGEFDNCHDRPMRPFHLTQKKIIMPSKHAYAMLGEGRNEKSMRTVEKVTINITKCADRSKTKCEHYQRMQWTSGKIICPLLQSTNTPWESIMRAFNPRLKCPFPEGNFSVDMTPDFKTLSKVPFVDGDSFWVVQFEFFDETFLPWLCYYSECDFPQVRG